MGAHCRVDHFEWWIEVMYSLGLILQRLCGFTGIYRAARAPKKRKRKLKQDYFPSFLEVQTILLPIWSLLFEIMSFPGRFTEAPPKEVPLLLQMQGSGEAEKQGSREAEKQKSKEAEKAPNCWAQPGKNIAHLLCHQSGPLERLQLGEIGPSR